MEWIKLIFKFYFYYPGFRLADMALLRQYMFDNPYKISKKFLEERGEKEVYTYGETPLTTMELIADRAKIKPDNHFFELGCGRGRTCFFMHFVYGCPVVGIEWVPEFIVKAQEVQVKQEINGIEFRCEDLLESSFAGANVVYICGTTWEDSLIEKITEKCAALPAGTKIITVSYSLEPYSPPGTFKITDSFTAPFLWGESEVFVQTR